MSIGSYLHRTRRHVARTITCLRRRLTHIHTNETGVTVIDNIHIRSCNRAIKLSDITSIAYPSTHAVTVGP